MKLPTVPYVLSTRQSSKQTLQWTMLHPEKEKDGVCKSNIAPPAKIQSR